MDSCERWLEAICARLDGEAEEGLEAHLGECGRCRERARLLEEARSSLAGVTDEPSPAFLPRLQDRLRRPATGWLHRTLPREESLGAALTRIFGVSLLAALLFAGLALLLVAATSGGGKWSPPEVARDVDRLHGLLPAALRGPENRFLPLLALGLLVAGVGGLAALRLPAFARKLAQGGDVSGGEAARLSSGLLLLGGLGVALAGLFETFLWNLYHHVIPAFHGHPEVAWRVYLGAFKAWTALVALGTLAVLAWRGPRGPRAQAAAAALAVLAGLAVEPLAWGPFGLQNLVRVWRGVLPPLEFATEIVLAVGLAGFAAGGLLALAAWTPRWRSGPAAAWLVATLALASLWGQHVHRSLVVERQGAWVGVDSWPAMADRLPGLPEREDRVRTVAFLVARDYLPSGAEEERWLVTLPSRFPGRLRALLEDPRLRDLASGPYGFASRPVFQARQVAAWLDWDEPALLEAHEDEMRRRPGSRWPVAEIYVHLLAGDLFQPLPEGAVWRDRSEDPSLSLADVPDSAFDPRYVPWVRRSLRPLGLVRPVELVAWADRMAAGGVSRGRVSGTILRDGRPAAGLPVRLYPYLGGSPHQGLPEGLAAEMVENEARWLAQASHPRMELNLREFARLVTRTDAGGRFRFEGLMGGRPALLAVMLEGERSVRARGVPGAFLTPEGDLDLGAVELEVSP